MYALQTNPPSEQLAEKKILVWMRRDLRTTDHAALSAALSNAAKVWCLFVFDEEILAALKLRGLCCDRRVEFIREAVVELDRNLRQRGGGLIVRRGKPVQVVAEVARELNADLVVTNHDYEPAANTRDTAVASQLYADSIAFHSFKDQVIFEKDDLRTGSGNFYTVYTPYKKAWLKKLSSGDFAERVTFEHDKSVLALVPRAMDQPIPSLDDLGFKTTDLTSLGMPLGESGASLVLNEFLSRIAQYRKHRDFPAIRGSSYLSVHLRFGTISVRALVRAAMTFLHETLDDESGPATWLSELIWRDFFAQILYHRQDLEQHAFRREYDHLEWTEGKVAAERLAAWIAGKTGYPLVDAAMRQIAQSGYMHNRLRMVTASFLIKNLGINWRLGEAYFADQLNDFDLASNNGNWQWAASTGCDAQPFFRIFNPVTQSERFDADGEFIRLWVPELAMFPAKFIHAPWLAPAHVTDRWLGAQRYPFPIVDHTKTREVTLARYGKIRSQNLPS